MKKPERIVNAIIMVICFALGIFFTKTLPQKEDRSRELTLIKTCSILRYDYRTHEGIYNCKGVIIVSDVVKGF